MAVGRRLVIVAERDHSFVDIDTLEQLSIGRSPENDVVVKDDMVSRRHALIEKDADGELRVRDLKSFNGTYINERRIRDETLQLWEALRVGRTKLFLVERATSPALEGIQSGTDAIPAEDVPPPEEPVSPDPDAHEKEMSSTKTLDVGDALASKEMRAIIDQVVRREREELEQQISRRIRDESGPSLLGSLSGFKVRVRRSGPADGGGDFYDVFEEDALQDELLLTLGSVSGVGIAACVAGTVSRHTIRGVCAERDVNPGELLGPLRETLGQTLHPGSALSLLLARIDGEGKLRIGALGGCGVLHFKASSGEVDVLRPPGRRDEEAIRVQTLEAELAEGDRLLLCSDGAGAIRRADGEAYGPSRLQEALTKFGAEPSAKELVKTLAAGYATFTGDVPERDVTLMVVTRKGS